MFENKTIRRMIQRIQTLFLLGVVILMGATLMFPLWKAKLITVEALEITKVGVSEKTYLIGVLCFISILIALISIFMYKNRSLQVKLNSLNYLIISASLASIFYVVNGANSIVSDISLDGSYKIGTFLPIGALILNFLATRSIKKDEELIRSMDRIR